VLSDRGQQDPLPVLDYYKDCYKIGVSALAVTSQGYRDTRPWEAVASSIRHSKAIGFNQAMVFIELFHWSWLAIAQLLNNAAWWSGPLSQRLFLILQRKKLFHLL